MKKIKGLSIENCVNKAEKLISEYGICLLLFDVKGSSNFKDSNRLIKQLFEMMKDLNTKFSDYLPKNKLATLTREERGFECLLGDGSWAGINSSEAVKKIAKYQEENYPHIPLYWGIAKDGFDDKNLRVVR